MKVLALPISSLAEVAEVTKHPDADKLRLCKVNDGSGELVDVVCGAPNVRRGT